MADKLQFQQKLGGILERARGQKDRISLKEVETYFEDDGLSDEQLELVCDYLLSQKVVVIGYVKQGGTVADAAEKAPYTKEESAWLKKYLKELKEITPETEGERQKLLGQAVKGDALAKSRLIELYLPDVVEIAEEMRDPELYIGDLVQEGNVSLMLALDSLPGEDDEEQAIHAEIRAGIQAFIEEQTELKRRDRRMAEKVNELDEGIRTLTEDLGRKVSVAEVAGYMEMPEEEVLDILKIAGEDTDEEEHEHHHENEEDE